MWVFYLIGLIVQGIIWGVATNKVIENKGYSENWFWWGFFFGFLALIVACTKPQAQYYNSSSSSSSLFAASAEEKMKIQQQSLLEQGGWKCNKCGNVNPSYTGTCNCGNLKASNQTKEKEDKRETANFQKMKSYKDLLDSGVITQEEFDAKKEQLLGLSGIMKTAEADEPLLKRVFMFLEDGNWSEADSYCEKVLDQDPENALAYLGKLMAELHVSQLEDLLNCDRLFNDSNNYKKAVRFGEEKIAGILSDYIDFFIERNEKMRLTDIYNKAVTAMNAAKTESAYKSAAIAFKTIPGFQDANTLAEQCLEKAEDCHKDEIYASARKQMTGNDVSKYEAAIKTFSTISGWKDVDEQILACQRKIEEIKAKEEADRHEWLRQAEEKRIAEEKAAKKLKRIIAITALIVVACIAFFIVLKIVIIPKQKLNKAMRLIDSGNYDEAYVLLEEIGNKDAIISNKYDRAMAFIKSSDYDAAYALLEEIGNKDTIISNKNERAMALIESKDYDAAYLLLEEIGYKDAIISNKYDRAMSLIKSGDYDAALLLLEGLNYKDSADQIEKCYIGKLGEEKYNFIKNIKVGDTYKFGSYEQDNETSNGKEEIEWIVLDKDGMSVLLISKYALDCQPYNTTETSVTWETCSMRKWLNGTFLNSAFSESESAMIPAVTVSDDNNPKYGTSPGNCTTDQVFLLSITEAEKYFSTNSSRLCQGTAYCYAQKSLKGAFKVSDGNMWWWLRSPGAKSNFAAIVIGDSKIDPEGSIMIGGDRVKWSSYAVRPALWINLGS